MKIKHLVIQIAVMVGTFGAISSAKAQAVLTGDTRLACEAVLCLATGRPPNECRPSLERYFGISYRRFRDTVRGRQDFLNQCPASNQNSQMQTLVSAMANGAGRCDAQSLNATLLMWTGSDSGYTYISNRLPDYCSAYITNAYTDFSGTAPRYVGTPELGGYWVAAADYARALSEWNAQQQQQRSQTGSGG